MKSIDTMTTMEQATYIHWNA